MPDTVLSTGRWAELGLDKGDSESGPDLRNAFLTMYTMNYIMLYKVSTEKGEKIILVELIWKGFTGTVSLKDRKGLDEQEGEKTYQIEQIG